MAGLETDVANYLCGIAALSLTAGTNCFDVVFPEGSQDQAVCVVETPGEQDSHAAGPSLSKPAFENARFQVICRDATSAADTCRALARSIRLNLNRLAVTTLSTAGTKILSCNSLQRPFPLPPDKNNRVRWISNYECKLQDLGST